MRRALSSGISPTQDVRFSTLLAHATVTNIGGSEHVVEWQADTPRNAQTVFVMADEIGLPALPDCLKVSAAAARALGCT